ncbi:MAG: ADP-ribosylglycohydrolase family protein [Chromatiaceae bacterium]|jgi:ADP-ribosylglycohydrolase|nr:ADP-ribosylglycohydrolase family protein [Chromatiaceae bacterium]
MLGAIAGDIIGSVYEAQPVKSSDFALFPPGARFTDDSVLTVATADALLGDGDYPAAYRRYGRAYPDAGYGRRFFHWLLTDGAGPYQSFGNGSAMRVSPVGFALASADEVLAEAARSAAVTHDHPEGIKGAQATALAVFLARQGADQANIRTEIAQRFGYDLSRPLAAIRPGYCFDVSCQGSVPEALIAFLESTDYESAVRNAVSLGGDADTMAAIAGGVAEARYGSLPPAIAEAAHARLPAEFLLVLEKFERRFGPAT